MKYHIYPKSTYAFQKSRKAELILVYCGAALIKRPAVWTKLCQALSKDYAKPEEEKTKDHGGARKNYPFTFYTSTKYGLSRTKLSSSQLCKGLLLCRRSNPLSKWKKF